MLSQYSRSKLEEYIRCPRCFWLQEIQGVRKPSIPGYTLNSTVDMLLKREFDIARNTQTTPQILLDIDPKMHLVPFKNVYMDEWRNPKKGMRRPYTYDNKLVEIYGAVDDIWQDLHTGEIYVVDYKSTAKATEVTTLQTSLYHDVYRRQLEIYQWIAHAQGYPVNTVGYFLFANANVHAPLFKKTLTFRISLISYEGETNWVPDAIAHMLECVNSSVAPTSTRTCEWCIYRQKSCFINEFPELK